jgi:hypothetical protein
MINLVVIAISASLFAVLLIWWRWPAFRSGLEAPNAFMLRQERRFDDQLKRRSTSAVDPADDRPADVA